MDVMSKFRDRKSEIYIKKWKFWDKKSKFGDNKSKSFKKGWNNKIKKVQPLGLKVKTIRKKLFWEKKKKQFFFFEHMSSFEIKNSNFETKIATVKNVLQCIYFSLWEVFSECKLNKNMCI